MTELLFHVPALPSEHQKRVARQLKSRAFCQEKRRVLRALAKLPPVAGQQILHRASSDALQKLSRRHREILAGACDMLAGMRDFGPVGALELVTALSWALEEHDYPEK